MCFVGTWGVSEINKLSRIPARNAKKKNRNYDAGKSTLNYIGADTKSAPTSRASAVRGDGARSGTINVCQSRGGLRRALLPTPRKRSHPTNVHEVVDMLPNLPGSGARTLSSYFTIQRRGASRLTESCTEHQGTLRLIWHCYRVGICSGTSRRPIWCHINYC